MLKYLYNISLVLLLSFGIISCVDDSIKKEIESDGEEFNIDSFATGYSVAFDVSVDKLGGEAATRDEDMSDLDLEYYENYLDPEEFRVLFFDSKDRFLFESKSRWFTQIESKGGGSRWRVGIPIFQYLSDGYDEHISTNPDLSIDDTYNWERIAAIMRSEPFKIAILANRPSDINIPDLSDITEKQKQVDKFGKNGPFWGAKNSVASYDYPDNFSEIIKTVFDLHHCQYDPIYEGKSSNADDCYDFIMDYDEESLPQMGAVSSWLNSQRIRVQGEKVVDGKTVYDNTNYFYKLPHGQIKDQATGTTIKDLYNYADPDQYIPMYGIQVFEPLTTWVKGTTYNLSQQTGSQTGGYDYKHITLLRSVVKLELRIPWYDGDGDKIEVNNMYAQLFGNNFMARCEPMDVWTPTGDIWNDNHMVDCEWLRIREYGLYANAYGDDTKKNLYRERLSWFYGSWESQGWILKEHTPKSDFTVPSKPAHPRIFNPITQRLTCVYITDCYLPIEGKFHRWVVYCGEHHISDANVLNDLSERGIVPFFRIAVKKENDPDIEPVNPTAPGWKIYTIPIADYTKYKDEWGNEITNPARLVLTSDLYTNAQKTQRSTITSTGYPDNMNSQNINQADGIGYYRMVQSSNLDERYRPYPLLRNHHYRLTVSYKDDEEVINVEVMDGEKRIVGGIEFN